MRHLAAAALLANTALLPPALAAQATDTLAFDRTEVMIPMRDGVRLETVIFRPRGRPEPLPLLLNRTPYGVGEEDKGQLQVPYGDLARDGYVFVFQNIRGRFRSEGEFVMDRPLRDPHDPKGVDESTDAFDTADWLVKHVPNTNGRLGVLGVSYNGWLAAMAGIDPHPAVRALSPQGVMADLWMGDDDFHQGAFRQTIGVEFESWMQMSRNMSDRFRIPTYDTYDWYLEQGTPDSLTKRLDGRVPTWNNFVQHPTYDTFWVARSLPPKLTTVAVPTLIVGGWWDQENLYGTLVTYAALERHDSASRNHLLMGPWNHGSWGGRETQRLGKVDFREETGRRFREVQAQWFAHWLKDRPHQQPEALLFDGGAYTWRTFAQWPVKDAALRRLYFHGDGVLSFDPPTPGTRPAVTNGRPQYDSYLSDPAHPVPYRQRPIQETYHPRGSDWYTWLSQDQRFVDDRPDVLTWTTAPLEADVTVAGNISAHLFASTTGTDADWVVKLIDVFPDSMPEPRMGGYEFMIAGDIMRGRYRTSFRAARPIVPNRVAEYTVDLHQQLYTFKRRHRMMVQVQSTWFPLYDRNPQTFVPNIFTAKPAVYRAQTHRIWRTPARPSHVSVQVIPSR
jgi:uncharacterized protein